MESEYPTRFRAEGSVKRFDISRGYGFVVRDDIGPDILLDINVLRNFGQSSVADNSWVMLEVVQTQRGLLAVQVLEILPPGMGKLPPLPDFNNGDLDFILSLPLLPARVKWFDPMKGFGFANIFGRSEDVFIHVEVLCHCGLANLEVGEAIAVRIIEGPRGKMAAHICLWDRACTS